MTEELPPVRAEDLLLLQRQCSRSRCTGGCVCADTWDEVNRLRDVRERLQEEEAKRDG